MLSATTLEPQVSGAATPSVTSITAFGPWSLGSLALTAYQLPRTCSVAGAHRPSSLTLGNLLNTRNIPYCFCSHPSPTSSGSLKCFTYFFVLKLEHDLALSSNVSMTLHFYAVLGLEPGLYARQASTLAAQLHASSQLPFDAIAFAATTFTATVSSLCYLLSLLSP